MLLSARLPASRRFALALLAISAVASWRAPIAEAGFDFKRYCPSWLRTSKAMPRADVEISFEGKSAAFLRAYRILEEGFVGFPKRSRWFAHPSLEPRTQEWVELLLDVTPAERKLLLKRIRARPIADPNLQRIARFALYDWDAWHAYTTDFLSVAQLDQALIDSLQPVLNRMPDDLARSIHERIAAAYDGLSKWNGRKVGLFETVRGLRLAPKRSADAFIRNTLRADQRMAAAVQQGRTPMAAYADLLSTLRERIFAKTKNVSQYSADDVLAGALAVQEVLRRHRGRFPNGEILMTGSFPNGRAKLASSDVDCMVTHPGMKELFAELDAEVNGVLRAKYADAKLEFHAMWDTTAPHSPAEVNPLQIRVSEDRIELLVYGNEPILYKDANRYPFNYLEPEAYVLHTAVPGLSPGPVRRGWPQFQDPALPSVARKIPADEARRSLTERFASGSYADLEGTAEWLATPHAKPAIQAYVDTLLSVAPSDRAAVYAAFARRTPPDADLFRLTGLALFHQPTWLAFYAKISTTPQADRALFDALTPIFAEMPLPLRKRLAASIRRDYPTLSKEKWVQSWPRRKVYLELAPKRAIDVLIRQLEPPHAFFAAGIAAGKTADVVYQEYVDLLRKNYFVAQGVGGYRVADVFGAAREVQNVLRKLPAGSGEPPSLVFTGSFPTGRANLASSDLDVIPHHFSLEAHYPEMQAKINSRLRARHREVNLEVHSMFQNLTPLDAAIVSPIMVRVTAEKIELLVYPPIRPMRGDRYFLPKNYDAPLVYAID